MGDASEETLPIMCGNVSGLLHTKLFKCPGIRVPCVEYQGGFITPKDFTYVGNKHTLKDWKTAIRCKGIALRKLIESGGLDFYNHEELCTGKCVSRNMSVHSNFARTSLNSNFNNASSSLMQESDIPQMDSNTNSLDERAYTVLKQVQDPNSETDMQEIDMDAVGSLALQKFTLLGTVKKEPKEVDEADLVPVETSSGQTMCISTANGVTTYIMSPSQQKRSKYDVLSAQGQSDFDNLAESFPNIEDFLDESQQFWQSILKLGLMDSIMKEIKNAVDLMRTNWTSREDITEDEAVRMSRAISNLGLTHVLQVKLAEHKTAMSRQNIKLQMEIEELKRKLAESERRKEINHRKSEAFESLIELGNKVKSKSETPGKNVLYSDSATGAEAATSKRSLHSESPTPNKRRRKSQPSKDEDSDYSPSEDNVELIDEANNDNFKFQIQSE